MSFCVYIHKNRINGKVYIGQTCQKPSNRWNQGNGYKGSSYFYSAIQKYGWDNFEHIILEEGLNQEQANNKEIYYIKLYHSNDPDYGYNLQSGGHNALHSKATKEKMSRNQRGSNNSFYGHRHSEKVKKRIGQIEKGSNHHAARQVICIETGQIFNTLTEASIWCKGNANFRGKISEVCQGKRQSAGKHPVTGEKLHWRYL